MPREHMLFVTYHDSDIEDGIAYVVELARALSEDIVVLLIHKKDTILKKLENKMIAITFAEAGDHKTAVEMAKPANEKSPRDDSGKIRDLVLRMRKSGLHLSVESTNQKLVPGIRSYVKQYPSVDKVVLSPAVTESEALTTRDLSALVRTASRPLVTMTRQAVREALHSANSPKKRFAA
ncbi:MAG TPA: hypothetical protein VEM40_05655 [Nitrospirota bacterium]|nr:hypothetical protein [Nitrospirota bacterium]